MSDKANKIPKTNSSDCPKTTVSTANDVSNEQLLKDSEKVFEISNPAEAETFINPLLVEVEAEDDAEAVVKAAPPLVADPDLEVKVRKACEKISENVHICANEPSLAFFRLSEHVRKALPPTVENRQQVQSIQRQLGGAYEDAELALRDVNSMEEAAPSLESTQELLRQAILLQQQIKHEQSKRPNKKEPSMYQRLSAHLTSVEILSEIRDIGGNTNSSSSSRVSSSLIADDSTSISSSNNAATKSESPPPASVTVKH